MRTLAAVSLVVMASGVACQRDPVAPRGAPMAEPEGQSEVLLAALECTVDVGRGQMTCGPASVDPAGGRFDVIVGNQDRFVRLANTAPSTSSGILSTDVTVQNLTLQPMATTDGTTPLAEGVRVFFHTGPTNGVQVANEDGTGTFTASNQEFFQYTGAELGGDGILEQGEVSSPQTWEFTLNGATTFQFTVFVTADVPEENRITVSLLQISSGIGGHTCAIGSDGFTYCWGLNSNGQLGDGTTTDRIVPTLVSGGLTFDEITAGAFSTCALTSGGAAYCWGSAGSGRLGNGALSGNQTTPAAVDQSSSGAFTQIEAGNGFGCGITSSGTAWCWGFGTSGQLGNGGTTSQATPVQVDQTNSGSFSQISAGGSHTCGIGAGGAAWCWGDDTDGQLGNGATTGNQTTPSAVTGGLVFTQVSAGSGTTCGVATTPSSGSGYCWGEDGSGQLGNGGTMGDQPAPSPIAGGLSFSHIAAAFSHACGLTTGGTAYCWGSDSFGRLGNGATTGNQDSPSLVDGGLTFAEIAPSPSAFTCARETGGAGHCWGMNTSAGQLGDGTATDRDSPVFVAATRN